MCLIISGIMACIFNVGGGIMAAVMYLGMQDQVMQAIEQQNQAPGMGQDELLMVMNVYGYGGIGVAVLGLIGGILMVLGGIKMRNLSGWGIAVLAALASILPCSQVCCLYGVPIGIWCLVVLFDSRVKEAFR